ncbi:MAG: UDP-N-acetylenolpyruvoylglucosamine reductase [Flavobacterium sp. SCGC AAA160-P02]|nr:MAG: UDP-N-acetylenolpyruvoylglucosamine reductase [Flavobacterium sp. SCGC AAA160-P02]
MTIQENISLKPFNTFGVDVTAEKFVSIDHFYQLQEILKKEKNIFLLSGGSNMLLTRNIDQLVVHINMKGITLDDENEDNVFITANAGEDWHDFVQWCISKNYGGLENLSLIPGFVGTCPIQNIGAYGVEVKDVITKVETLEIISGKKIDFSNEDCRFSYRNSIFKNELKGKHIITSVSFKLSKKNHQLNTEYGTIETELKNKNIINPTIQDISNAVIKIRKSKLPDPKKIGNSGSFFKNPIISSKQYKKLREKYPTMPFYELDSLESNQKDVLYKIPAGWLIETMGFKGKRFGDCGVHEKQALVLVNYNNAKGNDIFSLAKKIQKTILNTFEIALEIEVNVFD